jgi:1-acyl-sn-glycerol-3-phosphate acyltransferase
MGSKIASFILKLFGWQIKGEYPNQEPKNVLVVVPHTSWVDFPIGVLVRAARGLETKFLAKRSLFKPLIGSFFKWMGGHPVDRSGNKRMVDLVIDIFDEHEELDIAIAPEGTRKKVDHLKTGFYWIAKGAGASIVLVKFDYKNKIVDFSDPFYPGEDAKKDIAEIESYFKGVQGKVPEYSF